MEDPSGDRGSESFRFEDSFDALTCGRLGGSCCPCQHGGRSASLSNVPSFSAVSVPAAALPARGRAVLPGPPMSRAHEIEDLGRPAVVDEPLEA